MRRWDKAYAAAFILVIAFFCCSIAVRFVTANVLVERLGMSNGFTELVLGGGQAGAGGEEDADEDASTGMAAAPKVNVHAVDIDWPELYPFADGGAPRQKEEDAAKVVPVYNSRYESLAGAIRMRVESYATDHLIGRQTLLEVAKACNAAMRWNYVSYDEYNGIVETDDGYLTTVNPRRDIRNRAEAVVGLARECSSSGSPFLYVCAVQGMQGRGFRNLWRA